MWRKYYKIRGVIGSFTCCVLSLALLHNESCFVPNQTKKAVTNFKPSSVNAITNVSSGQCSFCQADHYLDNCTQLSELLNTKRQEFAAEKRLCFKCLRSGHRVHNCRFMKRCGLCSGYHHTLLHQYSVESKANSQSPRIYNKNKPTGADFSQNLNPQFGKNSKIVNRVENSFSLAENVGSRVENIESRAESFVNQIANNSGASTSSYQTQTCKQLTLINNSADSSFDFQSLLPTAMVNVKDVAGNNHACRVLIDFGSMASYISESCMQRLQLPRTKAELYLRGVSGGGNSTRGQTLVPEMIQMSKLLSTF